MDIYRSNTDGDNSEILVETRNNHIYFYIVGQEDDTINQ